MNKSNRSAATTKVNIDSNTLKALQKLSTEESQTIVHCNYVSPQKYPDGGWVNIFPSTYLSNGKKMLPMIQALNIPLAPHIHVFKNPGELKRFTLVFPPLPKEWKSFTFLEICLGYDGFKVKDIKRNNSGIYEISIY